MSPETAPHEAPPEIPDRLRTVVQAIQDRKGEELKVLHLAEVSDFTEFFLICSGTSERQVQAIADAIVEATKAAGRRPLGVEGYGHGRWVLLDYGDIVIHVFDQELRGYYALERLWGDAVDVTGAASA